MISSLYLYGALSVVVALAFVIVPFIRKQQTKQLPSNNNLLIQAYKQRLEELNEEIATGKLSESDHQAAVIEQKRRLLIELSPQTSLSDSGNKTTLGVSAVLFMVSFVAIFYYMTGNLGLLNQWQQAKDALPDLGKRAVLNQGEPLSNNELQQFALALRTKLAEQGDDEIAWLLLGRVVMSLNDFEMGAQAFEKVLKINPNSVNGLVSYAQALLIEGSEGSINKAAKHLSKVLQLEPTNRDAISMLALIAYERGDWQEAKAAFELVLARLKETDAGYVAVKARIAEIDEKLKSANNLQQNAALQGPAISVTIELADELKQAVPQNAVLFVFAKAVAGPPMPVAVVKLADFNFPQTVVLSDANAMVDGLNLSSTPSIKLVARVSRDENVAAAEGELQGESAELVVSDTQQYVLKINQRL